MSKNQFSKLFICFQISSLASPPAVLASKHMILSVVPRHEADSAPALPSSATLGGGRSGEAGITATRTADGRPLPTLGPVTERFVVVKRGQDVILECHDADGNWVYWRKHGGEGICK